MISRFEQDVQSDSPEEIPQKVYVDEQSAPLVLDVGEKPPEGFTEYTGDLKDLDEPKVEE